MTRTTKHCLTLAIGSFLAVATSVPVAAEDYPFSGLFWPAVGSIDMTGVDARCALSFLDQRKDGTWTVYHADLAGFKASGAVKYHKLSEGSCAYNSDTRVESCMVTLDRSSPESAGTSFHDVLRSVDDQMVQTVMIMAESDWKTVPQESDPTDAGAAMNYLRCPFPDEALRSRISAEPTSLPADDLNALRFPSDVLLADPDVTALVQALRGE